jgi:tetratricopeptide (TPR) repeat protein
VTAKNVNENESAQTQAEQAQADARARLAGTGRNDACPCGSGKKYKKCHLAVDESALVAPPAAPDPEVMLTNGWRLFEQRRPGAAEKEFRAALGLRPEWSDAHAGIGLARLQSGDNDGARSEFREVQRVSEAIAAELRASKAKDAFNRKEAQAYIRSCHALGCLAFDDKKYDDALVELERVYAVDEGPVGTEARLIAGVALIKLKRAPEAVTVLEIAAKSETGAGRGPMSLALAHFLAGDTKAADIDLDAALTANPNLAKALLAKIPKRPANLGGAAPGSKEEALGYVQTYGDAWEAPAKKFLEEFVERRVAPKPAGAEGAAEAG